MCIACRIRPRKYIKMKVSYDIAKLPKLITNLARIYKSGLSTLHIDGKTIITPVRYSYLGVRIEIDEQGSLTITTPTLERLTTSERQRVINFIKNVLKYSEGRLAGKPEVVEERPSPIIRLI